MAGGGARPALFLRLVASRLPFHKLGKNSQIMLWLSPEPKLWAGTTVSAPKGFPHGNSL